MADQDYKAILEEEFEVLESIFPEELQKLDETSVRIRVEPEEPSSAHPLALYLIVEYPPTYPDIIPELRFEAIEDEDDEEETGELTEEEEKMLLEQLEEVATESLGMAMTFTIASSAREHLSALIATRLRLEKEEDDRRTAAYEEAERERTRGTAVTPAKFDSWRKAFLAELAKKREKDEEERVRAMQPREREDYKRKKERLSGRQLFEQSKTLATSDEALYEEGSAEVDLSQYSREQRDADRRKEEEKEERRRQGLVAEDSDEE